MASRGKWARPTLAERLERNIEYDTNGGCWLWSRSTFHGGYGQIRRNGTKIGEHASRLSWEQYRGPVPKGLLVLHRCDVPACINPEHLFLGTHEINMADMVEKGRALRGTRNPKAKLTENLVREIRQRVAAGACQSDIARELNISPQNVCAMVKGRPLETRPMSRVAPKSGELVEATPRRAMTAARKRRIWDAHEGFCRCGAFVPVDGPGVTYDHWSPIEFGSPDDDEHVWPLCDICNREKTERDQGNIAHVRRLRAKNADPATRALAKPNKRKLQGRGFPKNIHRQRSGDA